MLFKVTVASTKDEAKKGKTYTFPAQKVKIGRLKENDITLDFPAVSGYHGKLRLENGEDEHPQVFITDFGSLNGILIDGHRIKANKETPIELDRPFEICIFNLTVAAVPTEGNEAAVDDAENDPQHSVTMPLAEIAPDMKEERKSGSTQRNESSEAQSKDKKEQSEQKQATDREKEEKKSIEESEKGKITEHKESTANEEIEPDQPKKREEASDVEKISAKSSDEPLLKFKAGEAALEELELEAEQLLSLWGMVRSPDDKPVPGVTIESENLGKTETDKDGSFLFDDIPEGTDYKISLTKPGFHFEPAELEGAVEEELSFAIKAVELTTVKGQVLHQDTPLAGVEVNGGELGKIETDKDGTFVFKEVPRTSDYSLKLSKSEFEFEPETVHGRAGESAVPAIAAIKLVTVQGRVVHKGKPLEGVQIDAGPLGKTKTDGDGVYKFEKVREDTEFTITARKPKYNFKPPKK